MNSIPPDKTVLFLPDRNLGNYVQRQTGRQNMQDLAGQPASCTRRFRRGAWPKRSMAHPRAKVVAHPECPPNVLDMADFIGSTSAIIDWCVRSDATEFIVMTESGVNHSLEKLAPEKQFYFVANENCNCSECPYMRLNTLEKLRDCLRTLEPRVELPGGNHAPRPAAARANARRQVNHMAAQPLIDTFGRVHDNLRISVTDRCNIRCFYCMPENERAASTTRSEILDFEEIERFVRIAVGLGDQQGADHGRRAAGAPRSAGADPSGSSRSRASTIWR